MIDTEMVDRLLGADAVDSSADRIGEVSQVYLDAKTERPTWVSVRLGLLHSAEVLVPLDDAKWDDRSLHVAVGRDVVRSAPRMEADEPLTDREQERLYAHYGIPGVRHPRSAADMIDVVDGDVCYSVHDDDTAMAGASRA